MPSERPIVIATRGSALALAQSNMIAAQCRQAFPRLTFELKIMKTTGDKLQTGALGKPLSALPKGLFTKELEVALLKHRADLAVHSLKDLPTELPAGLKLGAVGRRADVRDVLIYRDAAYLKQLAEQVANNPAAVSEWTPGQAERRGFAPGLTLPKLPAGAVVATSSPRRKAQVLAANPAVKIVELRGNVPTRLQKLAEREDLDALILAAAGLERLHFTIDRDGRLSGDAVPDGLRAVPIAPESMLPCVGQGAIGIETRADDGRIDAICARLNHFNTAQCVRAERAFLQAMGGGCQTPMGAYAEVVGDNLRLRAVSFLTETPRRAEQSGLLTDPEALGAAVAASLKA